jgi:leucine dehydrogenase
MASEPNADAAAIDARVAAIGDTITTIFHEAEANGTTTLEAAEDLSAARLAA